MRGKPDSELIEAVLRGDVEGFTELCRRYYPAMVAIAHSITSDRHLAEDAAQQTFAKVVRRLGQLRDRGKFGGWLGVICRNSAKDMVKDLRRENVTSDFTEVAVNPSENHTVETVREAIRGLPETDREVIYLRYYDGMAYGRMSAVLGISEQAINGRLRRAKAKIAEYLRDGDLRQE